MRVYSIAPLPPPYGLRVALTRTLDGAGMVQAQASVLPPEANRPRLRVAGVPGSLRDDTREHIERYLQG